MKSPRHVAIGYDPEALYFKFDEERQVVKAYKSYEEDDVTELTRNSCWFLAGFLLAVAGDCTDD